MYSIQSLQDCRVACQHNQIGYVIMFASRAMTVAAMRVNFLT